MDTQESKRNIDGMQVAIGGSFVFWLSSFLMYIARYRMGGISDNHIVNLVATESIALLALSGLCLSLIFVAYWPVLYNMKGFWDKAVYVYAAGVVLGFVLWDLLEMKARVEYLQMLGTLTVAGIIGLILSPRSPQ